MARQHGLTPRTRRAGWCDIRAVCWEPLPTPGALPGVRLLRPVGILAEVRCPAQESSVLTSDPEAPGECICRTGVGVWEMNHSFFPYRERVPSPLTGSPSGCLDSGLPVKPFRAKTTIQFSPFRMPPPPRHCPPGGDAPTAFRAVSGWRFSALILVGVCSQLSCPKMATPFHLPPHSSVDTPRLRGGVYPLPMN